MYIYDYIYVEYLYNHRYCQILYIHILYLSLKYVYSCSILCFCSYQKLTWWIPKRGALQRRHVPRWQDLSNHYQHTWTSSTGRCWWKRSSKLVTLIIVYLLVPDHDDRHQWLGLRGSLHVFSKKSELNQDEQATPHERGNDIQPGSCCIEFWQWNAWSHFKSFC